MQWPLNSFFGKSPNWSVICLLHAIKRINSAWKDHLNTDVSDLNILSLSALESNCGTYVSRQVSVGTFWIKYVFYRAFWVTFFFTLFYHPLSAQFYFIQTQEIPVSLFQKQPQNAWAGGLNNPHFSNIDLNKDGDKDLIMFDRSGSRLLPFLYMGPVGTTHFLYAPQYQSDFPHIEDWLLAVDYNKDGRADIFAGENGGVIVYRQLNTGPGLSFSKDPIIIQTQREGIAEPLLVNAFDLPAITDIDLDGDLDILTFDLAGSFVEYHQNQSREMFGHSDSLIFQRVDACWGGFMEALSDNAVQLNILCKNGGNNSAISGGLHAGSTLLALDLDGDQDKDLLIGDISFSDMITLINGGNNQFAEMISQDNKFPASLPVDIDIFPAAFFVDVNQDNKRDLIVAPNSLTNSEDEKGILFYSNTGTDTSPLFNYIQNDFLQEEMIDLGSGSKPILIDYNGDGLQDLIIANDGTFAEGSFQSAIYLLQNTGTADSPEFQLVSRDMGSLSLLNYQGHVFPAFADLDDDDDLDMILGKADGTLDYFENISSRPTDVFPVFVRQQTNYLGIDVGNRATPTLFDLNADSLPDLIIGEQNANLNYWQHKGTAQSADFAFVNDSLGELKIKSSGNEAGAFVPQFLNTNGRLDLFLGQKNGRIAHYSDIIPELPFSLSDTSLSNIDVGNRAVAALSDLNADGKIDMIVGNLAGGLNLFIGSDTINVGLNREILPNLKADVFPNPAIREIVIQARELIHYIYDFRLLDYTGMEVFYLSQVPVGEAIRLPILSNGLYVVSGKTSDGRSLSTKLIIQAD